MGVRTSNFGSAKNISTADWVEDINAIDPILKLKNFNITDISDGRTLDVDFTTGVLNPNYLYNRNSRGSYIGSDGYIKFSNGNIVDDSRGPAFNTTPRWSWSSTTNQTVARIAGRSGDLDTGSRVSLSSQDGTRSVWFTPVGGHQVHGIFIFWVRKEASANNILDVSLRNSSQSSSAYFGDTTVGTGQASISILEGNATAKQGEFSQPNLHRITFHNNDWVKVKIIRKTEFDRFDMYLGGYNTASGSHIFDFCEFHLNLGYDETPFYPTTGTIVINTPRFTHDPSNLSAGCVGVLLETDVYNQFKNSNHLYNYNNATIDGGGTAFPYLSPAVISPDGTNNAQKITKSDDSNSTKTYQEGVFAPSWARLQSASYTASRYFKSDGHNVTISIETDTASDWGLVSNPKATFTVSATGIVQSLSTDNDCQTTVSYAGNGWYRCSMSFKSGSPIESPLNAAPTKILYELSEKSILTFGGQLERGQGPSSYIPSPTSSVALRDVDYITLRNDNIGTTFPPNFNVGVGGSIFIDAKLTKKPRVLASYARFITFRNISDTLESYGAFYRSTDLNAGVLTIVGGGNGGTKFQTSLDPFVPASNSETLSFKLISAVDLSLNPKAEVYLNDASTTTSLYNSTTGSLYTPTIIKIGAIPSNATGICLIVKRIIFWPYKLNPNYIKYLTTG